MHTSRARFARDIVAEYLPPRTLTKKTKVIIFCDGMPSVPYKWDLLDFYSRKGYWVFHPRYRGTWESGGTFLAQSPHLDILDVVTGVSTGFIDSWSNKKLKLKPEFIAVIGGSFGGPAALLSSVDKRVDKVVAICPVVDWKKLGTVESFPFMTRFIPQAFGQAYRMSKVGWNKLRQGKLYNPVSHSTTIPGNKTLVIHALDDDSVPVKPVKKFAQAIGAQTLYLKRGGHLSSTIIMKPGIYKKINSFLHAKTK